MLLNNPKTINLLLGIPVVGFMAVIDKAAWPFILLLAAPMILARYYPNKLMPKTTWSIAGMMAPKNITVTDEGNFAIKPVHFVVIAIAIFLLNTSPKRVETSSCREGMAVIVDQKVTLPVIKPKGIPFL